MATEIRNFAARAAVNDKFQIVGRAISYSVLSAEDVPGPGWREQIAPGCFNESLNTDDQRALWNHSTSAILGRKSAGTLTLSDSASGLDFVIQLDRTSPDHQSYYSAVRRGDVDGVSFGFVTISDAYDDTRKVRTVLKAELMEISPVTFPAYTTGTSAQARAEARAHYGARRGPAEKYIANTPRSAPSISPDIVQAALLLRRAARSMAKSDIKFRDGDFFPTTDSNSLDGNLQMAHEFMEAANAFSGTVRDMFDTYDPDSPDYDPDVLDCDAEDFRAIRKSHSLAHAAIEEACSKMGVTRSLHAKRRRKSGRK